MKKIVIQSILLFCLVTAFYWPSFAADETIFPVFNAKYTATPPKIDGVPEPATWNALTPSAYFKQWNGTPAPQNTYAKLLWDKDNLYIFFMVEDVDIRASLTKFDDSLFKEEVVEIFIDPNSDSKDYLEFEVNPLNTVMDLKINKPENKFDMKWNAEGMKTFALANGAVSKKVNPEDKTAPALEAKSWTVEIAIPWKNFSDAPNLPPQPGDCWRMNMFRCDNWPQTTFDSWAPTMTPKPNFHMPEKFGRLCFIK